MEFEDYVQALNNFLDESLDRIVIIGGSALFAYFGGDREISEDFDIYFMNDGFFENYLAFDNDIFRFENGVELDVVDSLATDDYEEETSDSIIPLTNYLMTDNRGFVMRKSGVRVLNLKGLFISKLASFYDASYERVKDLDDLDLILEEWSDKIPPSVSQVITRFGLAEALEYFMKKLARVKAIN